MSSTDAARPGAAFGPEVYAARRERAAAHAREAGLTGLLVSPGPDLAYFTGYAPPETERLTLLAIPAAIYSLIMFFTAAAFGFVVSRGAEEPDAEPAPAPAE